MTKAQTKLKLLSKADRRKEWKLLKAKHAKAIQASGINFDAGFGKQLDKFGAEIDKLNKLAAANKLTQGSQFDAMLKASGPLTSTTATYRDKVKDSVKLTPLAKKELIALFKAVKGDLTSWAEVKTVVGSDNNDYREVKFAVQDIDQFLERKEAPVAVIVKRGERFVAHLQGLVKANTPPPPNQDDEREAKRQLAEQFIELTSRLDQAARQFTPASREIRKLAPGAKQNQNVAHFVARAAAMQKLLERLMKASTLFQSGWEGKHPDDNQHADGRALSEAHAEITQNPSGVSQFIKEMRDAQKK